MLEGSARDTLFHNFKVLKLDPSVENPGAVLEAEEFLGDEVVQEIKASVLGE
jgi:hypothetical protein